MKSMEVSFPVSSDQFELNLVCYVQELIINNDLKQTHQFLAQINLLILGMIMLGYWMETYYHHRWSAFSNQL